MTHYVFPPAPTFGIGSEAFTYWQNGFTNDELKLIIDFGNSQIPSKSSVGSGVSGGMIPNEKSSEISWINLNNNSKWIYDKIIHIMMSLNTQFYQFNLYGFIDQIQFINYEADENENCDWHTDLQNQQPPRKLSFILELSDPKDYEGGELQIINYKDPLTIRKEKGLAIVFPSFSLYRVSPVTKGTKKIIVICATGPAFK
jgi:PKHD-type hydroxylase